MRYLLLFVSVFSFGQQTKSFDFISVLAKIEINPLDKSVSGEVTYNFEVNNTIDTNTVIIKSKSYFLKVINQEKTN